MFLSLPAIAMMYGEVLVNGHWCWVSVALQALGFRMAKDESEPEAEPALGARDRQQDKYVAFKLARVRT